ncbi:MAG: hypothetical protein OXI58_10510 [Gemmatimonadota bacterium]|nr:hypothetical protein [Gemmatimonadota bacterium]
MLKIPIRVLHTIALQLFVCLALLYGCASEDTDQRFANPAQTFQTYKRALENSDFDLLWECFSSSQVVGEDRQSFVERWRQKTPAEIKVQLRREIAEERIINERIGYLLFDSSTLGDERASPFFYFIRDSSGWKITSHLDSTFHQELEQAIERGEYKLPDF